MADFVAEAVNLCSGISSASWHKINPLCCFFSLTYDKVDLYINEIILEDLTSTNIVSYWARGKNTGNDIFIFSVCTIY